MNNTEFDSILQLKVTGIIEMLLEDKRRTLESALKLLYSSRMYELLADENTKLWHLSITKLHEMLLKEKESGTLQLPDFV